MKLVGSKISNMNKKLSRWWMLCELLSLDICLCGTSFGMFECEVLHCAARVTLRKHFPCCVYTRLIRYLRFFFTFFASVIHYYIHEIFSNKL
jgi:hypothetical protein